METTIDFGAGDLAFWGPLAALGDGILPDNHPQKYERKYSTDVHNQYRGLAEGCLYEAASRGGRFLAGKVAVIAAGGCAYAAGAGFAAKARYAQRAGATAVVIMWWTDASDRRKWTHAEVSEGVARPRYYSPASHPWVDEISIPVVHIVHNDGWALRAWLANGLDLIAFRIDSRTLGIRVAGTCGTVDRGGTPCPAHQVKHVNGEATCYTDCHKLTLAPTQLTLGNSDAYQGSENTTMSGLACETPCRDDTGGSSNSIWRGWRGPWCWTNQTVGEWESCGIPACTLKGTLHANVGSCNGILGVNAFELTSGFDGEEWTWSECARECLAAHSDAVAIDGPKHGSCYCHTSCPDLLDCGEDDSMALNGFELPTSCGSGP